MVGAPLASTSSVELVLPWCAIGVQLALCKCCVSTVFVLLWFRYSFCFDIVQAWHSLFLVSRWYSLAVQVACGTWQPGPTKGRSVGGRCDVYPWCIRGRSGVDWESIRGRCGIDSGSSIRGRSEVDPGWSWVNPGSVWGRLDPWRSPQGLRGLRQDLQPQRPAEDLERREARHGRGFFPFSTDQRTLATQVKEGRQGADTQSKHM